MDGDGGGDILPILDNTAGRTNTTCLPPSHVMDNGNCISTLSMVLNGTTMEEDIRLTQQGGGVG